MPLQSSHIIDDAITLGLGLHWLHLAACRQVMCPMPSHSPCRQLLRTVPGSFNLLATAEHPHLGHSTCWQLLSIRTWVIQLAGNC